MSRGRKKVVDLTAQRRKREPVHYSVSISHDEAGMTVMVADMEDSPKSRAAVANDLAFAAKQLRDSVE